MSSPTLTADEDLRWRAICQYFYDTQKSRLCENSERDAISATSTL
jgi:hypothetical protein